MERPGGSTLYAIGMAGQSDGGTGVAPMAGPAPVLSLNLTYAQGKRLLTTV